MTVVAGAPLFAVIALVWLLSMAAGILALRRHTRTILRQIDQVETHLLTSGDRHLELMGRHDDMKATLQRVHDRQQYGPRGPVK